MNGEPAHAPLDGETLAERLPHDSKADIRLWLRLLTCSNLIEAVVRGRLHDRFRFSLPRFDLMAQLDREPDGLRLSDLSRRMMVTNGNVTGLVDRLVKEGLVERRTSTVDRRVAHVRLTEDGKANFTRMAGEHEQWIASLFSGLDTQQIEDLMASLAALKTSVRSSAASPVRLTQTFKNTGTA